MVRIDKHLTMACVAWLAVVAGSWDPADLKAAEVQGASSPQVIEKDVPIEDLGNDGGVDIEANLTVPSLEPTLAEPEISEPLPVDLPEGGVIGANAASPPASLESLFISPPRKTSEPEPAGIAAEESKNHVALEPAQTPLVMPAEIPAELEPEDESATADAGAAAIETIRERYSNGRVKIEREVTQDAFKNYMNHGSWKMWDAEGRLIAEGQHVHGRRDGTWSRWHRREDSALFASYPFSQFTGPFISQATFRDGKLHGTWMLFDAKERKISEWKFEDGQRHGLSTWWYPNGRKFREMTFHEASIHGELLEWNPEGQLVTKDAYQFGRKLAAKKEYHTGDNKKSEGVYLFAKIVVKTPDDWWEAQTAVYTEVGNDEKHGLWRAWYPTGQVQMQGEYRNDREVGTFVWWFPNGQKALEGGYKNGKPHGLWTWWHKNGQKSTQGAYVGGLQAGRWTMWNENGKVAQAAQHEMPDNRVGEVAAEPKSARLPANGAVVK